MNNETEKTLNTTAYILIIIAEIIYIYVTNNDLNDDNINNNIKSTTDNFNNQSSTENNIMQNEPNFFL